MRERMTPEQAAYERSKKVYFRAIHLALKSERDLTKEQMTKIANKIAELTLHLIDNERTEAAGDNS